MARLTGIRSFMVVFKIDRRTAGRKTLQVGYFHIARVLDLLWRPTLHINASHKASTRKFSKEHVDHVATLNVRSQVVTRASLVHTRVE